MNRRSFLAASTLATAALAGCTSSGEGSPEPESDGREEYLASESDPDVELEDYGFEELEQSWAVTGTVANAGDERSDIRVRVNFLDDENTVIDENYTILTDIASGQAAEFSVRFLGDDVDRVETYELILEFR